MEFRSRAVSAHPRELFTAVVGDVCDDIGLRGRFLPPHILPLGGRLASVMAGRAMPVLEQDVNVEPADGSQFGRMLEALDSLRPDEIYVSIGATRPYALFGELMSIAAMKRGAAGVVATAMCAIRRRFSNSDFRFSAAAAMRLTSAAVAWWSIPSRRSIWANCAFPPATFWWGIPTVSFPSRRSGRGSVQPGARESSKREWGEGGIGARYVGIAGVSTFRSVLNRSQSGDYCKTPAPRQRSQSRESATTSPAYWKSAPRSASAG